MEVSENKVNFQVEDWHQAAHARLDKAFQLSHQLTFDDQSKYILFSDCHRGLNDRHDIFAPNANLFLEVLGHYYQQGFTYIENGDGDELWHNRHFKDIREAYGPVFELIHAFKNKNRLYLIAGNHDSTDGMFDQMEKDGIPLYQGLILRYGLTEKSLFVVHSHQAGKRGDERWWFNRLQSRYFWKHVISYGFYTWYYLSEPEQGLPQRQQLEQIPTWLSNWILSKAEAVVTAVKRWAALKQQPIICGHTHLCDFPNSDGVPYFNIGQCITPGYLTGLEIANGRLTLVKWKFNNRSLKRFPLSEMALTAVL